MAGGAIKCRGRKYSKLSLLRHVFMGYVWKVSDAQMRLEAWRKIGYKGITGDAISNQYNLPAGAGLSWSL